MAGEECLTKRQKGTTIEEYHQRLATFSEHLESLGTSIDQVVDFYHQGVDSCQRKLMPIARRFTDFGLRKD